MKKRTVILICFIVLLSVFILPISGVTMAGTLSHVEKLTDTEKKELSSAESKVSDALKNVEDVKAKIAAAHNMHGQEYMEWRSWVEFDGDYILYRYQSYMSNITITGR